MTAPSWRAEQGQSAVELVALLPLTLLVGLAVMAVLGTRSAAGEAAAAAHAGAMALIQDADGAEEAARAALPTRARRRAQILVRGRRVTVTVRAALQPRFVARALAATATASASAGLGASP